MELVEQTVKLPSEELQALQHAFACFSEQTAQLREAYRQLKERAEQIDLELEAANKELKRKVQELDEAYHFQAGILRSIPTAVVVTDLDGTIRTMNPAAEQLWRVDASRSLGKHFKDVMRPDHGLLQGVLEHQHGRRQLRREIDGGERIICSTACLVEDSRGRPIGAVQADNDITRQRRLESELCQREKLADLGRMAAGLAHEIRKPLNGIKGFASLLERNAPEGEAEHRYVGNIMSAADRLNSMLARLLDFARPDDSHIAACDLAAAAAEVVEFLRAEFPQDGVAIELNVPPECAGVMADADRLRQVLLNLGKNGVEALDGSGRVLLAAVREGGAAVRVMVSDTGRGIGEDELPRVREPFYTRKPGGTGLGLAIVHRILQLHGSELEMESRPGAGTTAAFVLQAAQEAATT